MNGVTGFRTPHRGTEVADAEGPPPGELPTIPASDEDETLWPLQWDMRQMQVEEAHEVTGGSPAVVAGTIDTGVTTGTPTWRRTCRTPTAPTA